MEDRSIVRAAVMAITAQNVAPRPAPLSTALMQGICINRNIKSGETVCCCCNDGGGLLRMGDVPAFSDDYFIDENNRMYDVSAGKLRVRDGLSGLTFDDTADAYGFLVANGGQCCAYKTDSSTNSWVVIYPDGSRSGEITFPFDAAPVLGYRNGILGVAGNIAGSNGATVYSYRKNGTLIAQLASLPERLSTAEFVAPLNATTVGVLTQYLSTWLNYGYYHYNVCSETGAVSYSPCAGLNVGAYGQEFRWLGVDQGYGYGYARLYDDEDPRVPLSEWVVLKIDLDDPAGAEQAETYYDYRTWYSPLNPWGHIVRQRTENGTTVRELVDMDAMAAVFTDELTGLPATSKVRENESCIWIPGSGVYQKAPSGWLMYPTSAYPREEPWGKLGYAVRNVNIGREGLAVVLFE